MIVTKDDVLALLQRGEQKYGNRTKLFDEAKKIYPQLTYEQVREIERSKYGIPRAEIVLVRQLSL